MKMQLLVATAIATWLVLGVSGELSAQQMPAIEVQVVQVAQDAGDAAKDEDAEEEDGGDEDKKKGEDDEDKEDGDKNGKGDDDEDEKGDKGHKGKGKGEDKAGNPVIIINIYINGKAVVEGHGKSKD